MKAIKGLILFTIAAVMLVACNKVSYRKTPGGMPYKLFRGKGTELIKNGDFIKFNITQKIKDSVYFTTDGKMPIYMPVMEAQSAKYDVSELWTKLRKGDSVIATQLIDTFIKRNPQSVPPEFKNGDQIVTTIKILDIFASDSLARLDEEKLKNEWLKSELAVVQKYVDDKKVPVEKTPSGALVHIIKPGEGNKIDSGKYVSIMYRGTSFSGKVFDTNMDSSFHHTDPYTFAAGQGAMIKGFDEAILMLRNGAEAMVYIPSMLGYGPRPNSPDIKPYEHLVFEVRVVNVQDTPPAPPPPAGPQKVR
jgi:FKBP-type peptidyl-prolyl cis-trans isomerase FkpA